MRKLEYFEKELSASPLGREILAVARSHAEEVSRLVNTNRVVMVAWQRNHGPQFLMSAMDSGFDETTPVTKEIEGVTLQRLLLHMADALQQAGSPALKASIARYAAAVMTGADQCDSLADLFGRIRAGTLAGMTP
jgi:hypothetical protein